MCLRHITYKSPFNDKVEFTNKENKHVTMDPKEEEVTQLFFLLGRYALQ